MLPDTFSNTYLKQLELLRLRSRRAFLGMKQGSHLSLKRGHGIEFADFRKYELGDNPRHIDWGVFARSDKLYVKTFREEEDMTVLLLLDASASMMVPEEDKKWEMARDLALSLAYISLLQQDQVVLSALSCFHSPHFSGARAIHQMGTLLAGVQPRPDTSFVREIQMAVARIRFPGKAVLISDFLMPWDEIENGIFALRAKNLDIAVIQVLSPSDLNPLRGKAEAIAVDSESGAQVELLMDDSARQEYGKLLEQHNAQLERYLSEQHISLSRVVSDQQVDDFVLNELTTTGLLG